MPIFLFLFVLFIIHSRHLAQDIQPCDYQAPLTCEMFSYVRYWNKEFDSKSCFQSPLRPHDRLPLHQQKFVIFEPYFGGWNNVRMAAEIAIMFAITTGRILVVPPVFLPSPKVNEILLSPENQVVPSPKDYLQDLLQLQLLNDSLVTMITLEDFLVQVALPGHLSHPWPSNYPSLEELLQQRHSHKLWDYLGKVGHVELWHPNKTFIGFNLSSPSLATSSSASSGINKIDVSLLKRRDYRYREMTIQYRRQPRIFDESLHNPTIILFPGNPHNRTTTTLAPFYTYLYWVNDQVDLFYRQLARDRLRYADEIFCIAGYIVEQLLLEAVHLFPQRSMPSPDLNHYQTLGGNTNYDATFYALHVRRDDFISFYTHTAQSGEILWQNVQSVLFPQVTKVLYIATDEQNKSYFDIFTTEKSSFRIKYFDDFLPGIIEKYPNFHIHQIPLIEQIVCANAHTFIGTPLSTFTSYITRLRGKYMLHWF